MLLRRRGPQAALLLGRERASQCWTGGAMPSKSANVKNEKQHEKPRRKEIL
jgi:hypothetical protein